MASKSVSIAVTCLWRMELVLIVAGADFRVSGMACAVWS
jgi:hypothetical protein